MAALEVPWRVWQQPVSSRCAMSPSRWATGVHPQAVPCARRRAERRGAASAATRWVDQRRDAGRGLIDEVSLPLAPVADGRMTRSASSRPPEPSAGTPRSSARCSRTRTSSCWARSRTAPSSAMRTRAWRGTTTWPFAGPLACCTTAGEAAGLLRNVAVALGNQGSPEAVPALTRALDARRRSTLSPGAEAGSRDVADRSTLRLDVGDCYHSSIVPH